MQNWKLLAGSLITVQMLLAGTGAAASGSADVLNDSSWVLSTLSGEEPLSGQRVTLHFAGCNHYHATYSTLTYRCGGQRVVLTQRGDKWQLNAGDQSVALRPVAAASGARYVGVSDDRSTFWSKAERASVVVAGQAYPECTLMPSTPGFRAAE